MAKPSAATLISTLFFACFMSSQSQAAALRIAPILVDVAKGATSTIELHNLERQQATVQVRIFRWSQANGKDQLLETRDVVASPPFVKLKPGRRNKIRIVRLTKRPLSGEESYRLLIDQVPERRRASALKVGIALRYSVPVFFGSNPQERPRLSWSVRQRGGKTYVTATNSGQRRARLTGLSLSSQAGKSLSVKKSLVGYVLGNSSATWTLNGQLVPSGGQGRISIIADTAYGKIRSKATLQTAQ